MRLSLLGSGLVKAVAVRAVERGFLSHDAAWDCASRWSKGLATSVWDVFDGFLTTEQVAQIVHDVQTSRPEGDFDSWDDPPATATKTSMPPPSSGGIDESRYELLEEIGTGGIGRVLRALDRGIGRVVALKTLKEGAEHQVGAEERFLAEAKITAELEHPNVVPIYDIGTLPNGKPYYTMRVVKRQSLQDVLASEELRKQWPLVRLIGAFVQISRALAYAHRRGILHRDIKPENIFLCDARGWNEGGERPVKILDFGIAKVLPHSTHVPPPAYQSREGATIGTPRYLSPEQALCMPVDERTDLYGAGLVLYAMVAGQGPFDCWAGDMAAILDAHVHEVPRPPSAHVSTISPALDAVVLRALAKDPADRFASAKDFADAIAAALAPTVAANEDRPAGLWTRLQRAQMSLTAAVLLVLGCTAFSLLVTFLVVGRAR